ncbi:MAG: Bax inhibitor-1 family protein [Candidatus Kariarchaeaceae archaeon]|jgi:FtsH-binding integral membrane protein
MSYYGRQPRGYQQQIGIDEFQKSLVLHKLTDGLILAAIMSAIVVFAPAGIALPLLGLGLIGYIISIIGYFFARNENTINTLYFVFAASSGAFLGATFRSVLTVLENGEGIILGAFGGTALIVGYLWYKVDSEHPDPNVVGRNLTKYSLIFIAILIMSFFIAFSNVIILLISIGGAALFSLFLYYDLARLQAGQYVSPARMAWSMYWDILLIFRYLLNILIMLFGNRK